MPSEINAERTHIGRAIVAHREQFGITAADLIVNCGPGEDNYLRWTERASRPSMLRLNWWHFLFSMALETKELTVSPAVGWREQWWANEHDTALFQAATRERKGVQWWWAPRRTSEGNGALCYVCGNLIHLFDVARPVTPPVRISVMEHRAQHIIAAGKPAADHREKVGH